MTDVIWLASYPKSGNTWLRILIGCLTHADARITDINAMAQNSGTSVMRGVFDDMTLIDSSNLTHDEIDRLRPGYHIDMANADNGLQATPGLPVRFVKTHDAYTRTEDGRPLLGGAGAARGAIVIVRDPRDIAPSLANHTATQIDDAIGFLNNPAAVFSQSPIHRGAQLRQTLLDWSGHVTSWLDQRDIPIHVLRYEELVRDTPGALRAAMDFAGLSIAAESARRAAALAQFSNLQSLERQSGFREWRNRNDRARLFFRRGEAGSWRDELSPPQVSRIEMAQARVMSRLGYDISRNQAEGKTA